MGELHQPEGLFFEYKVMRNTASSDEYVNGISSVYSTFSSVLCAQSQSPSVCTFSPVAVWGHLIGSAS